MTWKQQLEPGAFRGVPFRVEVNELTGGRRTAPHEYPKRDKAFIEDMGRATRGITFDAYVIGPDYLVAKNALIDALERPGPGELVHPFYGRRTVQAGEFSVRETRDEGGMARFALVFTETAAPGQPRASTDTVDAVEAASEGAIEAAAESFLDRFSVAALPQWAVDKARDVVQLASDTMTSAFAPIRAQIETAADLNQDIVRLRDEADDLVRQPERLENLMRSIMGSVAASDADANTRASVLSSFYRGFAPAPDPVTTSTRQEVEDNRAALDAYLHQVGVANEAVVATQRVFDTLADAESARDGIADRLDEQAETAPDGVFDAMTALRARLVRAIPPEDASLPRLVTIRERATLPAVVLAYRLYADAERGTEVVNRNRVRHPGFVPGGVDLEVLSSE